MAYADYIARESDRYWKSVYSRRAIANITGTNDMLDRQNLQLAMGLTEDAEKHRIKAENAKNQSRRR